MLSNTWIKILFMAMVIYDGLLGLLFLFMPTVIFNQFNIPLPNHLGYVQFPALLLIVFAWMFFNIAKNPDANWNLIPYGIGLKVSYSGVIFYHWFTVGIPWLWQPFAVIDAVTAVLFLIAYSQLKKSRLEINTVVD